MSEENFREEVTTLINTSLSNIVSSAVGNKIGGNLFTDDERNKIEQKVQQIVTVIAEVSFDVVIYRQTIHTETKRQSLKTQMQRVYSCLGRLTKKWISKKRPEGILEYDIYKHCLTYRSVHHPWAIAKVLNVVKGQQDEDTKTSDLIREKISNYITLLSELKTHTKTRPTLFHDIIRGLFPGSSLPSDFLNMFGGIAVMSLFTIAYMKERNGKRRAEQAVNRLVHKYTMLSDANDGLKAEIQGYIDKEKPILPLFASAAIKAIHAVVTRIIVDFHVRRPR